MKRIEPQALIDIIEDVWRQNGLEQQALEQRLCYIWPEVVGPAVSKLTTRRFVESGVLHVWIASAPLKNDLQYLRQSLVEQLNRAVKANVITDIKFH